MQYENLLNEIYHEGIEVVQMNFKGSSKGLYGYNTIAIDSKIETDTERKCILAEELGHHHKTVGNILNTSDVRNAKQEKIARNWGYEKLVGILGLISAFKSGARTKHQLAEYFDVTEEFLEEAIQHYKERYGQYCEIDNYIVYFEPNLIILEMF